MLGITGHPVALFGHRFSSHLSHSLQCNGGRVILYAPPIFCSNCNYCSELTFNFMADKHILDTSVAQVQCSFEQVLPCLQTVVTAALKLCRFVYTYSWLATVAMYHLIRFYNQYIWIWFIRYGRGRFCFDILNCDELSQSN